MRFHDSRNNKENGRNTLKSSPNNRMHFSFYILREMSVPAERSEFSPRIFLQLVYCGMFNDAMSLHV